MSMPLTRRRRAPRGSGVRLRNEILDAATQLMLKTGEVKAVSIRAVAQRVGVTPPSIYLHFADKDALLDAVCARYFEQLDEQMQQAALDKPTILQPTDAVLRLTATCVCGSDLWPYRGADATAGPAPHSPSSLSCADASLPYKRAIA